MLLRTYYAKTVNVSGAITATRACPQKFVCPGGQATAAFDPTQPAVTAGTTVLQCPDGTYTERTGASSEKACSKCHLLFSTHADSQGSLCKDPLLALYLSMWSANVVGDHGTCVYYGLQPCQKLTANSTRHTVNGKKSCAGQHNTE